MLLLKRPNLVVNSHDVPGPKYTMWATVNAVRGMTASDLVNEIVRANRAALEQEETHLLNVVINCHGLEGGGLAIGGKGTGVVVDSSNVGSFSVLKKRNVGTIWLVACGAAEGADGKRFCQLLATSSGCEVVAADVDQYVEAWGAWRLAVVPGSRNQIDEFEGTVFSFRANGTSGEIDPHEDIDTILD